MVNLTKIYVGLLISHVRFIFAEVVITHHICEKSTRLLWKDTGQSLGSGIY